MSPKVVILDVSRELQVVADYMDEVLSEYPEWRGLRNELIIKFLKMRLEEVTYLRDDSTDYAPVVPSAIYRHLHSMPAEETHWIDKALNRRVLHMRRELGEVCVKKLRIKVDELILVIEC